MKRVFKVLMDRVNNKLSYIVRVQSSDRSFHAKAGMSVLVAMTPSHGENITAGCFSGGCGVCKIQVIEGECSSGVMSKAHVSDDDLENGYYLACKVYPESDLVIRVLNKVPPKQSHRFGYFAG
jgi:ferredoxin